MTKPLTIARREFVEAMNRIVADSGLPYSMLADIFKDAYNQMITLDNEQYLQDKKAYEDSLKKE